MSHRHEDEVRGVVAKNAFPPLWVPDGFQLDIGTCVGYPRGVDQEFSVLHLTSVVDKAGGGGALRAPRMSPVQELRCQAVVWPTQRSLPAVLPKVV